MFLFKTVYRWGIDCPPEQRNFADIKTLQANSNTLIVETSSSALMLELTLPWLPERKARVAIPYALEDQLAQPVNELHFAFDKQRYQNNQYTITVIDKKRILFLIDKLDEHEIEFEAITLDWFALTDYGIICSDSILLINEDDFKGALSEELALTYLKKHPFSSVLLFEDSTISPETSSTKLDGLSYTWIARQLLKSKPLNLCQGEIQHGNTSNWIKKGYILAGALGCLWLLSLILVNAINLYSLNKQHAKLDQEISVIYHEFFPEAKQVISPRFRIGQLLEKNTSDNQSRFWFILNQLAKATKDNGMTIEQLRFQNKTMLITIVCNDFVTLEKIENNLRILQMKVKQTQASTREQQVIATLELT